MLHGIERSMWRLDTKIFQPGRSCVYWPVHNAIPFPLTAIRETSKAFMGLSDCSIKLDDNRAKVFAN